MSGNPTNQELRRIFVLKSAAHTMSKMDPGACDDENGNCKACGHPFAPHLVIAYDGNDLTKGGELRCQVADCDCFRTLSFDLSDKEWNKKLNTLLKPPS